MSLFLSNPWPNPPMEHPRTPPLTTYLIQQKLQRSNGNPWRTDHCSGFWASGPHLELMVLTFCLHKARIGWGCKSHKCSFRSFSCLQALRTAVTTGEGWNPKSIMVSETYLSLTSLVRRKQIQTQALDQDWKEVDGQATIGRWHCQPDLCWCNSYLLKSP